MSTCVLSVEGINCNLNIFAPDGIETNFTVPASGTAATINGATIAGHNAKFDNTTGELVDSGAKTLAGTTAVYGGGGTSNAFSVTGLTSAAVGACVIRASTNAVSIVKALPGTNTLTVTFSADPGAGTIVDYNYLTAPQT